MAAKLIKRTYMLVILTVLCLNPVLVAIAEDCQDCEKSAPTPPGNVSYPEGWECECTDEKPNIVVTYSDNTGCENGEISDNCPVTLSATGGCPPYTWSTDSTGYSLYDNGDGTMELSVISGTCGSSYDVYATVTLMDACGVEDEAQIRNSAGDWGGYDRIYICEVSGEGVYEGLIDDNHYAYLIRGIYKYMQVSESIASHSCCGDKNPCGDTWCIGSGFEFEPCITSEGNYGVPCFEVPGNDCSKPCSGPFGDVRCMSKKLYKAEWICPP